MGTTVSKYAAALRRSAATLGCCHKTKAAVSGQRGGSENEAHASPMGFKNNPVHGDGGKGAEVAIAVVQCTVGKTNREEASKHADGSPVGNGAVGPDEEGKEHDVAESWVELA